MLLFDDKDDLLAMARPNTGCIEKYKLVEQFQKLGIKSVFNLQTSGKSESYVFVRLMLCKKAHFFFYQKESMQVVVQNFNHQGSLMTPMNLCQVISSSITLPGRIMLKPQYPTC